MVSSLVFHYVKDYKEIVEKIFNWLKYKGEFIFSVEHPIRTASYTQREIKQDDLGRDFYAIYNYRDENDIKHKWFVEDIQKYHRRISTYMNVLIECGFTIKNVLEPMPSDEDVKQYSKFYSHRISPPVLIIKAKKIR